MLIEIASRYTPERQYISVRVQRSAESGYEVTDLESPIEKVLRYYENILQGEFDYSFVNDRGQHLFYGTPAHRARNLLLAVAQEAAQHGRQPRFIASSQVLSGWLASPDFAEALLPLRSQTLSQLEAVIGNDAEATSDFAAWLYFFLQQSLVAGRANSTIVGTLIRSIIEDAGEFSADLLLAVNSLDPTFIGLWAEEGSYQKLRRRSLTQQRSLSLLSSFAPANDPRAVRPSRAGSRLRLAARSAGDRSSVATPDIWNVIDEVLANVAPSPSPSFLPRLGDPAAVANRILRYFDFKLPLLEEMAHVLGTQVISAELPNDVLGLFVTNTDAHHSAILVNRSSRSEGSQRFTIAHELGHYLLHSDSAFLCGYREVYEHQQELETEANSFAAELLMPTAKMRDLTVRRFDCTRVSDIAQRFNCSTEAAARRFIDIAHNRQLALVVVRNGQVLSVAASIINQQGVRWFGRPSAGQEAVCFDEALHLRDHRENRLGRYLPAAQANWLNDLDIDMYPFRDGDGYYLFIERS